MSADKPLRLGLVGAGRWGQAYLRTIASLKTATLSRLASRSPEARRLAGPECRISPDWQELISAKDLDALIVAAPPAVHAEIAREAVLAALPVLVEKPLTMDLASARKLLELAQVRKALVWVDHVHLFHPAYEELKRLARKLGLPRSIESSGGARGPFRPDVGPLWDYGPHDVALCLDLLGKKPTALRAGRELAKSLPEGSGENLRLELDFPGGAKAAIRVGNLMEKKTRSFLVRFDRQTLVMDDQRAEKLVLREDGGAETPIEVSSALPLTRAVEAFIAAVRAGSKDLASLRLGIDVVEVLAACEAALLLDRPGV